MTAGPIYVILALASTGGTLFTIGIVFYTRTQFGWGTAENFRLGAAQGLVYTVGALLANRLTGRLSHRSALVALHAAMIAACAAGVAAGLHVAAAAVTGVLLAYTFLSAVAWPILESLLSTGTAGRALVHRLGVYNAVWPAVGAASMAASGRVIEQWPTGVFLLPAVAHVLCVAAGLLVRPLPAGEAEAAAGGPAHPEPEPELLRARTVALWVSRLGLPATYAVIYGLMPLMPSLPAMRSFDVATQTVVCSVWLLARWVTFLLFGFATWWHARPRVMVAAAVAMLAAFLGITLAPSQVLGRGASPTIDLMAILLWQVVLGAALGVIYSGSLYFGMVLSDGSTEHSGYHEALIGVGWVLGPGAGALMQVAYPDDARAGVLAVGTVIGLSVAAVVSASVVAASRRGPVPGPRGTGQG